MPVTRLVLTTTGLVCAAALVVPAALISDAAAPARHLGGSSHADHAVPGTPPTRTAATASTHRPALRTALASGRAAPLPRIRGYVGTDFTITVSKRRVPKGRYRLVVKDEGATHNWHIEGRGVDRQTTIDDTGKWVWKVRLRKGTYRIVCDAHPTQMNTSLKVTSG